MVEQHNHPLPQARRILALDPGARRTGVAISDELGMFAHPRPALLVPGPNRLTEAVAAIVDREHISEVVVGLPLSLAGTDTAQTADVRDVVRRLRERLTVPVTEWDERLSSVEAARTVHGRERRARGELDSAAAAVVLQAVLDHRRAGAGR